MIKLKTLLLEDPYNTFTGFLRITFDNSEYNASTATEAIRSVEGVTVARIVGGTENYEDKVTLSVKIRSMSDGHSSFINVRKKALTIPGIKKIEIGTKTIEKI